MTTVSVNGVSTQLVFVAGGQDNVTALDTGNGNIIWQKNLGNVKGEFIYASTSFYNGSVYIGISSFGDCPLVQGQVVQLDASMGTIQNTFNVVPNSCVGGSGPETGDGSISAGAYDGTYLFQAGGKTTINGQKCMGSLRAMDPNTGNFIWQICLGSPVLDSVIAVPGIVVVGWSSNMYVVDSAHGTTLFKYQDKTSNAKFWGAATISNGMLFDGSRSGKLFAFGP